MALDWPFYASLCPRPTSGLCSCPKADKGASFSFVLLLWPFQALHLTGGLERPCFEFLRVFGPKQIKGLDSVPREARLASWALCSTPAAVLVPRGTAKPPGLTLLCSSCLFFCYKVKVSYAVWARISVGSVRFRFVRSSLSSSFVEFRRVSTRSSFCSSSLAPFGAYETCCCQPSWALLPSFGSLGVARHGGWGAGAWACWMV